MGEVWVGGGAPTALLMVYGQCTGVSLHVNCALKLCGALKAMSGWLRGRWPMHPNPTHRHSTHCSALMRGPCGARPKPRGQTAGSACPSDCWRSGPAFSPAAAALPPPPLRSCPNRHLPAVGRPDSIAGPLAPWPKGQLVASVPVAGVAFEGLAPWLLPCATGQAAGGAAAGGAAAASGSADAASSAGFVLVSGPPVA